MKKILHIVGSMNVGGIQQFLMNVYKNMDRQKVMFDFAVMNQNCFYEDEISSLGGHCYYIGRTKTPFQQRKLLIDVLKNGYDYVHIHTSNSLFINCAIIVKKHSKSKVIYHSHNSNSSNKYFHYLLRHLLNKYCDSLLACSFEAAKWMYTKASIEKNMVKIIYNGVDTEKFKYNLLFSSQVKKELGLYNEVIYGHIGRFSDQKNHLYLIDIFSEIYKLNKDSVLVLVGDGPNKNEVERKVRLLNLEKNVYFLGIRKDVNFLLSAIDIFIMPSLHEGLPVTLVEAQCAGVKCYISDSISKEIDCTELINRFSLQDNPKDIAQRIIEDNINGLINRENFNALMRKSKYDISNTLKQFSEIYELGDN